MAQRRRRESARPEATPAEFKAMAHPLRLRILRLCLHESLTNKDIADHLGQDPATTLHHVRTLTKTGFLEAEPVRAGRRGALEKPYRATGKSWILAVPRSQDQMVTVLATLEALRAEIAEAGPEALVNNSRLGLRLSDTEVVELSERIDDLVREYAARPPTASGQKYGLSVTLHRLRTQRADGRGSPASK